MCRKKRECAFSLSFVSFRPRRLRRVSRLAEVERGGIATPRRASRGRALLLADISGDASRTRDSNALVSSRRASEGARECHILGSRRIVRSASRKTDCRSLDTRRGDALLRQRPSRELFFLRQHLARDALIVLLLRRHRSLVVSLLRVSPSRRLRGFVGRRPQVPRLDSPLALGDVAARVAVPVVQRLPLIVPRIRPQARPERARRPRCVVPRHQEPAARRDTEPSSVAKK